MQSSIEHSPSALPWVVAMPGKAGLPGIVLRHLVDSRYAATAAGGLPWAMRTTGDIYSVAGGGAQLSDTEDALDQLKAYGLVENVKRDSGTTHWVATEAGASAIEHRPR